MRSAARRTEENVRRSMEENLDLQSRCKTLEEDLRLEREWRCALQDSAVSERTAIAELKQQIEETEEFRSVSSASFLFFSLRHLKFRNRSTTDFKRSTAN